MVYFKTQPRTDKSGRIFWERLWLKKGRFLFDDDAADDDDDDELKN
jgi:hypothetical protein